jgi:nucleoside-diphosphate-sugar epimerase
VYVDDVVEAQIAIAAHDGLRGRTVDVGTGTLTSVRDIAIGLGQRLALEGLLDYECYSRPASRTDSEGGY